MDNLTMLRHQSNPLSIEGLNPFYKRYLEMFYNSTDAPLEYIFTSLLPSLGAAITTRRWIQWGTTNVYPNIWTMIVGPSTLMRKSTSLNTGLHYNIQFDKAHPERNYMLPNDGSYAALLKVLEEEKQGVLKHPEVASLLENMGKGYNNNMKSKFTECFDVSEPQKVSFKNEDDIYIEQPIFSMATATTLNWLKQKITKNDRESGFLARFLYSYQDKKDRSIDIPISPDPKALAEVHSIYDKLFNLPPREILFDSSFCRVYEQYYEDIEKLCNDPLLDEGTKSLTGRLQTDYLLKLTILECVLTGKDTATEAEALRVLNQIKFFLGQAFTIMDQILKTERTKHEEKVLEFLRIRGKASLTDLHHLFSNNIHATNLKATMKTLEEVQLVRKCGSVKNMYYELFVPFVMMTND